MHEDSAVIHWLLWLSISMGLSAGINELTRARFDYATDDAGRAEVTGSLELQSENARHKFDLITVRVIAGGASRVWGTPIVVRELWLASGEPDAGREPDLELFVDFGGAEPPLDADARVIDSLLRRELPVLPIALGSRTHSRVRLPGSPTAWDVVEGTMVIRQSLPVAGMQQGASWRIEGDLQLTVAEGKTRHRLTGPLNALLAWY
jgi:hypothetical protein